MPLIRCRDVDLFYDLTGPDQAPVVAFSNSIGTTLEMWDRQIPALFNRYRCLRYDTRGHGRSPVVNKPARVEELADDLAGLLDALGIATAHIVGLSLGGICASVWATPSSAGAKSRADGHVSLPASWLGRARCDRAGERHGSDR